LKKDLRKKDSLLESLVLYTKLFHKPYTEESLLSGLPIDSNLTDQTLFSKSSSKSLFSRAAARAGLKAMLIERPICEILELQLPIILVLSNDNSCILSAFSSDRTQAKIIFPGDEALEEWVSVEKLEHEYLGYAFLIRKEFQYEKNNNVLDTSHQRH
jgi:ATP-binding cassette subfamily C protein LapB